MAASEAAARTRPARSTARSRCGAPASRRSCDDQVALELGADVPFFAHNVDSALVSGRGEHIAPQPVATDLGLLLVTPPIAMSTAAVFARFDALNSKDERRPPTPDFVHLAEQSELLRDANELWPAAVSLAPRLGVLRDDLERLSGRPWLMSGSGSTLFAIYESGVEAAASGRALVASESEVLDGALINAVDLVGPDPLWRYP